MAPCAIVTGSDSGIGRATAVALARRGWDVGVTFNRDEDGARETAREVESHGRRAVVRHLDLSEHASVRATIGALADEVGGLDALVNNSGTGKPGPLAELALADWQEVLAIDLTGAFLCAQEAAARMIAAGRGGRIVNVTSVHEHVPHRGQGAYAVAKAGLGMLTKALALELAEHQITVNSVAPGETSTPMNDQEDADVGEEERPGIPLGRPGDARETAAAIAFLCSPESSYVTGASFPVDGGMLLMAAEANQIAMPDP
jgi:NAD(P)-dependent dehydrogenase (short-subunit alcohol dehydrogenase family)